MLNTMVNRLNKKAKIISLHPELRNIGFADDKIKESSQRKGKNLND